MKDNVLQAASHACEKRIEDNAYSLPSDQEGDPSLISKKGDKPGKKKKSEEGEGEEELHITKVTVHARADEGDLSKTLNASEHMSPIISWLMREGVPRPEMHHADQGQATCSSSSLECQCTRIKPLIYSLLKQVDSERDKIQSKHHQYHEAELACREASSALSAREELRVAQENAIRELKSQLVEKEEEMKKKREKHRQVVCHLEERIATMTRERESLGQALIKQSEALRHKEREVEMLSRENKETLILLKREGKYLEKAST